MTWLKNKELSGWNFRSPPSSRGEQYWTRTHETPGCFTAWNIIAVWCYLKTDRPVQCVVSLNYNYKQPLFFFLRLHHRIFFLLKDRRGLFFTRVTTYNKRWFKYDRIWTLIKSFVFRFCIISYSDHWRHYTVPTGFFFSIEKAISLHPFSF